MSVHKPTATKSALEFDSSNGKKTRTDTCSPHHSKEFIGLNVRSARRMNQPPSEGEPARWVTPLAEPNFCSSCKRFDAFSAI